MWHCDMIVLESPSIFTPVFEMFLKVVGLKSVITLKVITIIFITAHNYFILCNTRPVNYLNLFSKQFNV